jgi:hypothetical protein
MKFWLKIFPIPQLNVGLKRLISLINRFSEAISLPRVTADFYFSSAYSGTRAVYDRRLNRGNALTFCAKLMT